MLAKYWSIPYFLYFKYLLNTHTDHNKWSGLHLFTQLTQILKQNQPHLKINTIDNLIGSNLFVI